MSSADHSEGIDIELSTTQADIEVLRRVREDQTIPFAKALALLSNFNPFPAELPDRPLPIDWEPFSL